MLAVESSVSKPSVNLMKSTNEIQDHRHQEPHGLSIPLWQQRGTMINEEYS